MATDLPPLPEFPQPTTVEPSELTDDQRSWLDGCVGDPWTQAVEGEVKAWRPDVDEHGRPVARLSIVTTDGLELDVEVRPPASPADADARAAAQAQADEDLAVAQAEWFALAERHREAAAAAASTSE